MSIYTYGPGHNGNVAMLTPSGGGSFPYIIRGPLGFSPMPGEIDREAAPSPAGNGSGWDQVLKQLALVGGTALVGRIFGGGDSRSTTPGTPPTFPTGESIVAVPAPVPGQAWTDLPSRPPAAPGPAPAAPSGIGLPLGTLAVIAAIAAAVLLLKR